MKQMRNEEVSIYVRRSWKCGLEAAEMEFFSFKHLRDLCVARLLLQGSKNQEVGQCYIKGAETCRRSLLLRLSR